MKRSEIPSHYEVLNGRIESARIEISDHHGMLDAWVMFDLGVASQGFGGYALYLPPSFKHHNARSFAGHHIFRIMQIADVTQWHELKNNAMRVVKHDV